MIPADLTIPSNNKSGLYEGNLLRPDLLYLLYGFLSMNMDMLPDIRWYVYVRKLRLS